MTARVLCKDSTKGRMHSHSKPKGLKPITLLTPLGAWQIGRVTLIGWCCFYYSIRNSLVALMEALFARICLDLRSRRAMVVPGTHGRCHPLHRLKTTPVFVKGREAWEHVPSNHPTAIISAGCFASKNVQLQLPFKWANGICSIQLDSHQRIEATAIRELRAEAVRPVYRLEYVLYPLQGLQSICPSSSAWRRIFPSPQRVKHVPLRQSTYLPLYVSMVYCGSAFGPGASRLLSYCAPLVCVPDVIGGLAVLRHKNKNHN